jgi:Rrf2 family protein
MAANTRMATAVQILCVIAWKGPAATTSEVVARSLRTNPVVVRRLLKAMQRHGLVDIRPGKDGGVQLARAPAEITLEQIHQAVEADADLFALRPRGNPNCPVDARMPDLLGPVFAAAGSAVRQTLGRTSLASLVAAIG